MKTRKIHNHKQIITSQYTSYLNHDESMENISIFVHKARARIRKKYRMYTYSHHAVSKPTQKRGARCSSLVGINKNKLKICVTHASHANILMKKSYYNDPNYFTDFAHNTSVSNLGFIKNPLIQTKWTVYRCQVGTTEDSCCCSCNSDAMFEVMKSLYDCYKSKNCDHCNCILCGHLSRDERDLALARKTLADIGATLPNDAEKREKTKKALSDMVGKSGPDKEKILRELAMANIQLPEPRTPSETNLINKVRRDLGLPPEPTNAADKAKLRKNELLGIAVIPLEGKTPEQKERILRAQLEKGIPFLPVGRTPSEKALINKIKAGETPLHKKASEKIRKAKTPEEKEKVLIELANQGIPFPEGRTPSERKLMDKVRNNLGLPPEPKTPSLREKYNKAASDGVLVPLEGKTPAQKEKILQDIADRGIPLPEGRTPSEKALIAKVKARPSSKKTPSEKIRKARAAGLITPLQGKTNEQREKILRGLADMGIPFPEGKTPSEKKLIAKVRTDLGLPPEPKSPSMRDKYNTAANDGLIVPLEGKTPAEKERILQDLADRGIPLPEGRTPSEKALIAKVKAKPKKGPTLSERIRKAKAAGMFTPFESKTPEEKEKILRGLANLGLPLPEGKTPSEKDLIAKVRADLGLPPEPKTPSQREKYNNAANEGVLFPLEGKTPAEKERILQNLANRGIPLPEGRTPSEKALIAKIKAMPLSQKPKISPSEKIRNAKAAGLITPLKGKTPEEREKKLRGLANMGIPLPEGKTPSERKIIAQVRADLGLPPEPRTPSIRDKYIKAANDGVLEPLEGKTPAEKEKILRNLAARGIPLPEGRTPSEKSLIAKINSESIPKVKPLSPSERMRRAKAAGLLTPLKGKSPEEIERVLKGIAMLGLPLPEGKTKSEKNLINKVRADLGIPPEPTTPAMRDKYDKAGNDGILLPLESKTPAEKEKILLDLANRAIPLPVGRTPSEKSLISKIKAKMKPLSMKRRNSERLRQAKAAGLLSPLQGKTPEQKENILKGLAMHGLPLPEGQKPSEKKLLDKVRYDLGLPPEPTSPAYRQKYKNAADAGLMGPLEGKTPAEKEKILKGLANMGIPLPEGRSASEKALIAKIKAKARPPSEGRRSSLGAPALPLRERRKLDAKTAKVMKEGKGPSEECICGLLTPDSERQRISKALAPGSILAEKLREAKAAGLLTPLEGKSPEQKEKILRALAKRGIPLPEGKSPSEKMKIEKVRADLGLPPEPRTPSLKEKYNKAQAAGIVTPLEGKSPAQKEKVLKDLAAMGVILPEGRTPSEKALIAAVKKAGPKGQTSGITTEKIRKAKAAGFLTPLAGKSPDQKEKILRGLAKAGFPLPAGKSPSDIALIRKIKSEFKIPEDTVSEKIRRARAAGLVTPLRGKTPDQKEKILRGLAAAGLPLPEGKTPSEKELIKKVKADTGYTTPSPLERMRRAQAAGLLTPLSGKTPEQKRKALRARMALGLPPPDGTTPSEKEIIRQLAEGKTYSQKLRDAKAAGYLTPLEGKTPEQKKQILRGLAKTGLPLPEGKTASERSLINQIRNELGLPRAPRSPSLKKKYQQAQEAGIITPLEGKTPAQKEDRLKKMLDAGIPLPEGRTHSEKSMIKKLKAARKLTPQQKIKEAKALGLLTPLEGKTPAQKEKILRALGKAGLPLPEANTDSEQNLMDKVRKDLGLPPEPKSPSLREKMRKALEDGIITPLEGKSAAQKENILKDLMDAGIPLPGGRTPSEKALIRKVKGLEPTKVTSEKLRKAKAAGLMTPLTGKKPAEQERILRGLADLGLPLPEGSTPSEKSMIHRIRTEKGLPPPALTPSEKEIVRKAGADGLLTPFPGKSPKEKERILKGLADAGLPLPIGTTPSEKALVRKIRAEAGLPLEPTPSEKRGKIKQKGKKVRAASKKLSKSQGGIGEEFEDIVKTTRCDRGCGCDKKKIRFKHSYVKIRVTSPDFSSICACPDDCFPRVKGGIFSDNEGIKVTVGSAIGVPLFSKQITYNRTPEKKTKSVSKIILDIDDRIISADTTDTEPFLYNTRQHKINIFSSRIETDNSKVYSTREKIGFKCGSNYNSNDNLSYSTCNTESDIPFSDSHDASSPAICEDWTEQSEGLDTSIGFSTGSVSITLISRDYSLSETNSSLSSMRTESSLKLSASSSLSDEVYRASSSSSNILSIDSVPFMSYPKSSCVYLRTPCQQFTYTSDSNELIDKLNSLRDKRKLFNVNKNQNEFLIFRATQSRFGFKDKTNISNRKTEPFVIINNLNNDRDVLKMVDELLAKREFYESSLFIVVPDSDDTSLEGSSGLHSTIGIPYSDTDRNWKKTKSTISVRKQSSVVTITDEYPNKLLHPKHAKEHIGTSTATANDNNVDKNPSPTFNCETHIKELQKMYLIEDQPIKMTNTTSTTPSVHGKTIKKNQFKQFMRNKHAKKKLAEVTSTSASSLDKRPKRNYVRWARRAASHGKALKPPKKERLDLNTEPNKSFKIDEPFRLQTLFKSVKARSHKRCQVVVAKTKNKIKANNNTGKQDDDFHSEVPNPIVQCVAGHVHETKLESYLMKNEANVFRTAARHNVCPSHGINRGHDQDCNNISYEHRMLKQSSENMLCPIHGFNANEGTEINENYLYRSTPISNSYSSEMLVRIKDSSVSRRRFSTSCKLLNNLRLVFSKRGSSEYGSEIKKEAVTCQRKDRAKENANRSSSGNCAQLRPSEAEENNNRYKMGNYNANKYGSYSDCSCWSSETEDNTNRYNMGNGNAINGSYVDCTCWSSGAEDNTNRYNRRNGNRDKHGSYTDCSRWSSEEEDKRNRCKKGSYTDCSCWSSEAEDKRNRCKKGSYTDCPRWTSEAEDRRNRCKKGSYTDCSCWSSEAEDKRNRCKKGSYVDCTCWSSGEEENTNRYNMRNSAADKKDIDSKKTSIRTGARKVNSESKGQRGSNTEDKQSKDNKKRYSRDTKVPVSSSESKEKNTKDLVLSGIKKTSIGTGDNTENAERRGKGRNGVIHQENTEDKQRKDNKERYSKDTKVPVSSSESNEKCTKGNDLDCPCWSSVAVDNILRYNKRKRNVDNKASWSSRIDPDTGIKETRINTGDRTENTERKGKGINGVVYQENTEDSSTVQLLFKRSKDNQERYSKDTKVPVTILKSKEQNTEASWTSRLVPDTGIKETRIRTADRTENTERNGKGKNGVVHQENTEDKQSKDNQERYSKDTKVPVTSSESNEINTKSKGNDIQYPFWNSEAEVSTHQYNMRHINSDKNGNVASWSSGLVTDTSIKEKRIRTGDRTENTDRKGKGKYGVVHQVNTEDKQSKANQERYSRDTEIPVTSSEPKEKYTKSKGIDLEYSFWNSEAEISTHQYNMGNSNADNNTSWSSGLVTDTGIKETRIRTGDRTENTVRKGKRKNGVVHQENIEDKHSKDNQERYSKNIKVPVTSSESKEKKSKRKQIEYSCWTSETSVKNNQYNMGHSSADKNGNDVDGQFEAENNTNRHNRENGKADKKGNDVDGQSEAEDDTNRHNRETGKADKKGCPCWKTRPDIGIKRTKIPTRARTDNAEGKGKGEQDVVHQENIEDKQSNNNQETHSKDTKVPVTSTESKEKSTVNGQNGNDLVGDVVGQSEAEDDNNRTNGENGKADKKGNDVECQCLPPEAEDNTNQHGKAGKKGNNAECQCWPFEAEDNTNQNDVGNGKGGKHGKNVECQCWPPEAEEAIQQNRGNDKAGKKGKNVECQCWPPESEEAIQHNKGNDKAGKKGKNVECQCWPPGSEEAIQHNRGNDKAGNKGKNVECQCWPPGSEEAIQHNKGNVKTGKKGKGVECQCWPSATDDNTNQSNAGNADKNSTGQIEDSKKAQAEHQGEDLDVLEPIKANDDVKDIKTRPHCIVDGDTDSFMDFYSDDNGNMEPNKNSPDCLLPLGEYHDLELAYLKDIMKMLSECSETTSGFTMNVLQRPPSCNEPTYAEVLKFYKAHAKEKKRQYAHSLDCGCPVDADAFKGFKVAVGGKGRLSKGLSGFLCFNVQTETTDSITLLSK